MPRVVDHDERRQFIAAALLRVVARDGLGSVSLRSVAKEAGATAGMVQHYFPSTESMTEFALRSASARYEARIEDRLRQLGKDTDPIPVLQVLLSSLLPTCAAEGMDARIALEFQVFATTHSAAAEQLAANNTRLVEYIARLLREADGACSSLYETAALALFAAAEGLAVQVLSAGLEPARARDVLYHLIDLATIHRVHPRDLLH